jgi:hypothetical protein
VFQQFKAWLTSIYQTVQRLRSPITPDIRDMFDRLLSTPDERATITPEAAERPVAKTPTPAHSESVTSDLAALHEQDAAETKPADAASVAEKADAEIDKTAQIHAPEVADELAGRDGPASGAGREPEAVERSTSSGDAGDAGKGADTEQPGAQRAGGGEPAAKGTGAPSEPPAGPHDTFGAGPADLVDKAGNIRLDLLNTTDDVKQALRESAARNGDFLAERRGVVHDVDLLQLADDWALDGSPASLQKMRDDFSGQELLGVGKLMLESATKLKDAMAKAAASGSEADLLAMAEAAKRHDMIQGTFSAKSADLGRGLRAHQLLKQIGGMDDAKALGGIAEQMTGKTLFQLEKMAKLGAALDPCGVIRVPTSCSWIS